MTYEQPQRVSLADLEQRRQAMLNAQQQIDQKRAEQARLPEWNRTFAPRSALPGKIGLFLVVASVVAGIASIIPVATTMTGLLTQAGYVSSDFDTTTLPDTVVAAITAAGLAMNLASWVGTAGWIMCIVAAATDRGKRAGVIGIVLGVAAPVIIAIVFTFAVWINVAGS